MLNLTIVCSFTFWACAVVKWYPGWFFRQFPSQTVFHSGKQRMQDFQEPLSIFLCPVLVWSWTCNQQSVYWKSKKTTNISSSVLYLVKVIFDDS